MSIKKIPIDITFVLDATTSSQPIFYSLIEQVNDLGLDLSKNYPKVNFNYGAVIYRDPVDYKEVKTEELIPYYRKQIEEYQKKQKKERHKKLRENGIDPVEYDEEIRERESHYDKSKYPFDENVAIDLQKDLEPLISELMKVECGAGNDEPEDWVGALTLALNSISWRDKSKRAIIWIADSNAHGKLFCGYDNHNEEEPKMEPLIQQMADKGIHFVGINVVCNDDRGCERTLTKIREMYQNFDGGSFLIEEYQRPTNLHLDENIWPEFEMNNFMEIINSSIKKLVELFDDSEI